MPYQLYHRALFDEFFAYAKHDENWFTIKSIHLLWPNVMRFLAACKVNLSWLEIKSESIFRSQVCILFVKVCDLKFLVPCSWHFTYINHIVCYNFKVSLFIWITCSFMTRQFYLILTKISFRRHYLCSIIYYQNKVWRGL